MVRGGAEVVLETFSRRKKAHIERWKEGRGKEKVEEKRYRGERSRDKWFAVEWGIKRQGKGGKWV